jgi:hypothetical protein
MSLPITKTLIIFWEEKGFSVQLLWDISIGAPISKIMDNDEFEECVIHWDLSISNCSIISSTNPEFNQFLIVNKAGKNQETISWEQIRELYK